MPSRKMRTAIYFCYGLNVEIRLKWTPLGVRTHLVGVPLLLFFSRGGQCLGDDDQISASCSLAALAFARPSACSEVYFKAEHVVCILKILFFDFMVVYLGSGGLLKRS